MKVLSLIFALMLGMTLNAGNFAEGGLCEKSVFSWNATAHDFGEIPQNVPAQTSFEVVNNSKEDLMILNVKGSCGCTVTEYTKTAIKPGEKGFVKATYNAKSLGRFSKTVTVNTNLSGEAVVLKIAGVVVAP